jgi:hypothetical protein
MRIGRVFQWKCLIDLDLDVTLSHHVEQIFRHRQQIGAFGRIGCQCWPCDVKRPFLCQQPEVKGLDRTG